MSGPVIEYISSELPQTLGPYRITGVLYEGHSASVLCGVGPQGERVAIKWGKPGRRSELAVHEELVLLQSIDHPGVISVLDSGSRDGRIWIAMPYYRSSKHPDRGPTEDRSTTLTVRHLRILASTLGWLHAHGIVHRDLKPANVLLDDFGLPVLADFGVSVRAMESDMREQVDPSKKGWTDGYAAPELYGHESVDGRVDLYALGVMLPGDSAFATIRGQLTAQRLELRPRYGQTVGERLEALGGGPLPRGWPSDSPQLLRARFVGRESELQEVRAWMDRGLLEEGGILFLRGPSGSGKTRLGKELSAYARQSGAEVFSVACGYGRTAREGMGSSLVIFRPLLRQIAELAASDGPVAVQALFGEHLDVLSWVEPSLSKLLPEGKPNRQLLNVSEAVTQACIYVLDQWSRRMPTLLLVDDVQWADELSLRILFRLCEFPELVPNLSVACTLRSEASKDFVAWATHKRVSFVDLRGLANEEVLTLIRSSIAGTLPTDVEQEIIHHAAGSPLMANWLLDEARASSRLVFRGGRWSWVEGAGVMTGRSDALLLSQLETLSKDARSLVYASAVLGRRSELHRAANVAEISVERARIAGQQLIAVNLLTKSPSKEVCFSHDKVVESVYRSMSDSTRRFYHLRAARSYDGTGMYSQLALHYEEAGQWNLALENYVLSAQRAYEEGRHQTVFALVERVRGLNNGQTLKYSTVDAKLGVNVVETQSLIAAGTLRRLELSSIAGLSLLNIRVPETRRQWAGMLARQIFVQLGLRLRERLRLPKAEYPRKTDMSHAAWFLYGLWWGAYCDTNKRVLQFLATAFWVANMSEKAEDWTTGARIAPALALMYGQMGLKGASESAYARSRQWAVWSGHPLAMIRWNVWRLFTETLAGQWGPAEVRLNETLQLARHHSATQDMENILVVRCLNLLFRGRIEQGMEYSDRWNNLPQEFRFEISQGPALTIRASLALILEKDEVVLDAVERIFNHFERDPNMTGHAAGARLMLACIAARKGDWEESFTLAEQVRDALGPHSSKHHTASVVQMFMPRLRARQVAHVKSQPQKLLISRAREAIREANKDARSKSHSVGVCLQAEAELSYACGDLPNAMSRANIALQTCEDLGLEQLSRELKDLIATLDDQV